MHCFPAEKDGEIAGNFDINHFLAVSPNFHFHHFGLSLIIRHVVFVCERIQTDLFMLDWCKSSEDDKALSEFPRFFDINARFGAIEGSVVGLVIFGYCGLLRGVEGH